MKSSQRLSFCGIMCALATVILLMSVFPYATYAIAALAGIVLIPVALELNTRYAIGCYAVTALLSLLLMPDPEAKMLFCFFFGYYPLIHLRLAVWRSPVLAWFVKFAVFNVSVLAAFAVLLMVMHLPFEELQIGGINLTWLLLPLANAVFVIFDIALARVAYTYRVRLHPVFQRIFRF